MSKQLKKGPKAKKLRPDILEVKFGWNLAKKTGSSHLVSQEPRTGIIVIVNSNSNSRHNNEKLITI
jgi:hypothetical protein